jgi:hypothetical protein
MAKLLMAAAVVAVIIPACAQAAEPYSPATFTKMCDEFNQHEGTTTGWHCNPKPAGIQLAMQLVGYTFERGIAEAQCNSILKTLHSKVEPGPITVEIKSQTDSYSCDDNPED